MVDIVGTIIDLIPSFIKSRLCSKEERKQRHLDDIKKDVLQPMFNNLTTIYIPILENEKEIVIASYSYNKEQVQFKLVPSLESKKIESIGLIVKPNYQKIKYEKFELSYFRILTCHHQRQLNLFVGICHNIPVTRVHNPDIQKC